MVTRSSIPDAEYVVGVPPDALSHPFRLDPTGEVATVPDGSIDHAVELVAVTLLTEHGERPLVPEFGCSDPVFTGVDVAELNVQLATYGPEGVSVTADTTYPNATTADVALTVTLEE